LRAASDRLNPRKNRGVHSDSDGQRNDDHCGEPGHAANRSRRVAQIAEHILDYEQPSLGAILLLHRLDAAEFNHGSASRFDWRQVGAKILGRLQRDVLLDFFAQAFFVSPPRYKVPQPREKSS
jgi:hypothetical protein